ncbi:MAG TPA: hypothetical protein VGI40_08615 [Pirellulaceae bacterium]|jgi:hypothetical protein
MSGERLVATRSVPCYASTQNTATQPRGDVQFGVAKKKLAELVREGLESGEGEEFTEARFDAMMDQARNEYDRRRSA